MVDPPPLPRRLGEMTTVVAVGTTLWLLGAAALAVTSYIHDRPLGLGFTTCVTGAVLGGIGYGIVAWQRSAARRGSRTAQHGVD